MSKAEAKHKSKWWRPVAVEGQVRSQIHSTNLENPKGWHKYSINPPSDENDYIILVRYEAQGPKNIPRSKDNGFDQIINQKEEH